MADLGKQRSPNIDGRRDEIISSLNAEDFHTLDRADLSTLQFQLGMGSVWGVWEIPAEFMPDGQLQRQALRTIKLESALPDGVSIHDQIAIHIWTELLRYAVARSLFFGIKRRARPSTVCTELHLLTRLVRTKLLNGIRTNGFWNRFSHEDFTSLSPAMGLYLFNTLIHFHARGLIPDAPSPPIRVEGAVPERSRAGEKLESSKLEDSKEWQPLPDEFTAELGWRSVQLIQIIGPTLLDAVEAAVNKPTLTRVDGTLFRHQRRRQLATAAMCDPIIANWKWVKPDGTPLDRIEFKLNIYESASRLMVKDQSLPTMQWPPKTFADAWSMLQLLQGANLFPVCLASGPRASEVSSFTTDCLVEAPGVGNRISGKTYKLVNQIGGRSRDFAAPEIVVQALLLQKRIAAIAKLRGKVSGNHLWVHISTYGRSKIGAKHLLLTRFLDDYARKLGLSHLLGNESPNLHIHRFRKTLARITALALVNSPTILMDCFGHEDPEMTLRRYILSDKSVARDVITIQRELTIAMAAKVIEASDALGGPAAEKLLERKTDFLKRIGKSKMEPQDAYEFAKRETFNGRTWMMVSPGIYCTLPQGNGGPCAKGQGGTNPAYCQSGCNFQIVQYEEAKIDDAIGEIVRNLQRAVNESEPMIIATWAGQLRNWLHRSKDALHKWGMHPLVIEYGRLKVEAA